MSAGRFEKMKQIRLLPVLAAFAALAGSATTVVRLSLEDIVDRSELIVTGRVVRTWAAWDGQHRYIWTHNQIAVRSVAQGSRTANLVVSEPGGVVGSDGMQIAGPPTYAPGEEVMLFLERMPNG